MKALLNQVFYSIIVSISLFVSCKDEELPEVLPSFKVTSDAGIISSKLSWNKPFGIDTLTTYCLYLNDRIVVEALKDTTFTISNLNENTRYFGKVTATKAGSISCEASFNFKTDENFPPSAISIFTNFITNDSISISWNKSKDPEGGPMKYSVYINNKLVYEVRNSLEYKIGNLLPNTDYAFKVIACDSLGKQATSSTTIKTITASGERLIHKNIVSGWVNRQYCYDRPSGVDSQKVPLFIYIHGAGGTPNSAWEMITRHQDKMPSEKGNFILAMPQGLQYPIGEDGAMMGGWSDGVFSTVDDVKYITDVIDDLIRNENVDQSRIYLSGHSWGGGFTLWLSRVLRNRIAAIVPMANYFYGDSFLNQANDFTWPLPIMYLHCTGDDIVSYYGSDKSNVPGMIKFWVKMNGCDTVPVTTKLPNINFSDGCDVTLFDYKGISVGSAVRFYRINGGNHALPGFPSGNQDFNTFEAAWDFCKQFSNPNYQN